MVNAKSIFSLILVLILVFSFFLTSWQLKKRSLLDWDEGYYLNIVKTWRATADWFIYKVFRPSIIKDTGIEEFVLERGGALNTFAKDGFLTVVFLFSYLFGIHDTTILWVSVIFGVLTVYLVYLIGKEVFGETAGLISAGIMAVSVYHLHYSRSGFPQTTSVFFLYLAVFLYLQSCQIAFNIRKCKRLIFFCGLSLGYAFCCHYNLIWSLPVFLSLEPVRAFIFEKKAIFKVTLTRTLLMCSGIIFPILFFGGISELIKLVLYLNPGYKLAIQGATGTGAFVSYFDRIQEFLAPLLTGGSGYVFSLNNPDPLFYLKLLVRWEGFFIVALLLLGITFLIFRQLRKSIFSEFIILALFLIPFLYWSFYPWQLSRNLIPAIPAAVLIIGNLLSRFLENKYKEGILQPAAVLIVILLIALQGFWRIKNELNFSSGFPKAIEYMKAHLGARHLSSDFTISRFLVGRKNALDISTSFKDSDIAEKLKGLYNEQGYRYLLLDQFRYYFKDSPIVQAAKRSKPVLVVAHSTDANLFENNFAGFATDISRAPKELEVYKLDEIIANLK